MRRQSENNGWEEDWDKWEECPSTADCDDIEMEITLDDTSDPDVLDPPDVDLTPVEDAA